MPRKAKNDSAPEAKFECCTVTRLRFTNGVFDEANPTLKDVLEPSRDGAKPRVFIAADREAIAANPELGRKIGRYLNANGIELACAPVLINGNAAAKIDSGKMSWRVSEALVESGISRKDYLIGIGGGNALDAIGFAAASCRRGVRLVRIPTTVTAQCHAMGPRCGFNMYAVKDGCSFNYPAWAVIDDFDLLDSLNDTEWKSGVAEAVKAAAVRDAKLLKTIGGAAADIAKRDKAAMEKLIRAAALIHLESAAKDGDDCPASPMQFAEWAAVKLRSQSRYRMSYGGALAIATVLSSAYAVAEKWIEAEDADAIGETLAAAGALAELDQHAYVLNRPEDLLKALDDIPAFGDGSESLAFPGPLGKCRIANGIDRAKFAEIIGQLRTTCTEIAKLPPPNGATAGSEGAAS